MTILVIAGALVTLAGLAGLVACILRVRSARRAGLPEEVFRRRMHSVIALNLGSLGLSAVGLAMVVAGLLLGG